MTKGLIFDIQRFSINDGPGIRTTVFFKGCGLRCRWCHNPESIASYVQLSYDPDKCDGCEKCVTFVQGNGIKMHEGKAVVDFTIHDRNLDLIDVCPRHAFGRFGREVDVDEVVNEVLKDLDYYVTSQGGVTFSGGEALNQWPFVEEVAKKLKQQGIHLTLDVSANDPNQDIKRTLNLIDLYLVDYKLTKPEAYDKYLGKSFDPTVMLHTLADAKKPVILRCVLIPDVNDTPEHFQAIADLKSRFTNIIQVDLLPYHKLIKRQQFRLINQREFYRVPDNADKKRWIEIIKKLDVTPVYLESKIIS